MGYGVARSGCRQAVPPSASIECRGGCARGLHRPLRALGGFEDYLWEHGGYDVEGPRATAEREARSVRYEKQQAVIRAALSQAGPWPASTTERTQNVEVLDVDRYGGFAVVIAAIEDDALGVVGPMLNASVFRSDDDNGGWRSVGGGGSGSGSDPLVRRPQWRDATKALTKSGTGWSALDDQRGRKGVCHAEVLCSPSVNTVIVDRVDDRRVADVSRGSGWVGLVWPEGQEPTVTALDATGQKLRVIPAREFHYDRHHRHLFGRLLRG